MKISNVRPGFSIIAEAPEARVSILISSFAQLQKAEHWLFLQPIRTSSAIKHFPNLNYTSYDHPQNFLKHYLHATEKVVTSTVILSIS
jgi:hypothetical protein